VASFQARLIKYIIVRRMMRGMFNPLKHSIRDIRKYNRSMDRRIGLPHDGEVEPMDIEGVRTEWLRTSGVDDTARKAVLYFHSGGFCLEYGNIHRGFSLALSRICSVPVVAVDYRLAPEYPYPAANEDCLKVYCWLLEQGYGPDSLIIGGDSCGAGLALMTLLAIRNKCLPMPKAAFLLSLMGGDLRDFNGESYTTRRKCDPVNTKAIIKKYGEFYLAGALLEPPLRQHLAGLPNLFIQVGDDDILLSDSLLLKENAEMVGVKTTFEVWKGMWHAFQRFMPLVPEARRAVDSLGKFMVNEFSLWRDSTVFLKRHEMVS